jgi:hypothetical protein
MFSLRTVILVDAAACAVMGAVLVAASGFIAPLTGLPAGLVFYAGLALLPIAAFMGLVAARAVIHTGAAWLVIAGNAAWIVASIALLLGSWVAPNGLGTAFVVAQALVVAALVVLEHGALRTATTLQAQTR